MKFLITSFFLIIASGLLSQTVISFNNPVPNAPTMCNDTWTESGIPQQLIPIPPATNCSFDYSSGDLFLFPARLTLDLSSLSNISVIEIDIIDFCSVGCTVVGIFSAGNSVGSASNSTTSATETIVYNNTAMDQIDAMTIESFENQMFEIRITELPSNTCPDDYAGGNMSGSMPALSGLLDLSIDYETDGSIISTQDIGSVTSGIIVDYDSATDITLDAGFQVNLGVSFHAFIDGCMGSMFRGDDESELSKNLRF
ncbi:hypothetical protein N9L92_00770 [Saprospiraceae bacterium]|nr:hypothetical protein [Saprospiraceae bacterium]